MILELLNTDEISRDLPEITNPKIFESSKFSKDGLFSQQIFGPIKSYYCACNRATYRGRISKGKICDHCHVEITTSEERRRRFAKVKLPFPVMNPIFLYILTMNRPSLKTILLDVLYYKNVYFFNAEGKLVKLRETTDLVDETVERLYGLNGTLKIIEKLIENDTRSEIQFIRDNFDKISIENVLIMPPDFRPSGNSNTGARVFDDINSIYSSLIIRSNHMKGVPYQVRESDDIYKTNFKHIQLNVILLYDYILEKLSKKKGLIRNNILGKRVDFSGRAVISPDPTLHLDECRVPYWMILEILKPQLVAHLVNRRVCKRYNQAVEIIENAISNKSLDLYEFVADFCKDKVCILNRQPTLHRLGVLGFKVTIHTGNTIQIHPMVCHPYNADFDGDAMAIYFPVTKKSEKDIREKVGIWNNLISPTDITIVPRPNQDITLGIYAATKEEGMENAKEIKGKLLPLGKYLFNECLPADFRLIDEAQNDKTLLFILNEIGLTYPPEVVMQTLDRIKNLGFTLSTLKGYTLSAKDLHSEALENIAESLEGDRAVDITRINSEEVENELHNLPFSDFIESGARGSWDQVKQLVLARGYVADSTGQIRPNLIRNSLMSGLTQEEFFDSCWGARKGLLDTALSTGDSGYLTRQLIYSTVFVELSKSLEDCGTTDGLDIKIKDENMSKSFLWRYHIKENGELEKIVRRNYLDLIGQTIKLRSPMYCKSDHVCKRCYGDLHRILHSNQVGIIATQAVGERTTQLVLRTFHLSGVAQSGTEQFDKQEDIISGISMANKLFHNPNAIKKITTPAELVLEIYELFNPYKAIHMVHYEVIVSAMMWAGNKQWRLTENREKVPFDYISILQVPSKASWLLGCAFSNLKQKLLDGLINSREDNITSLSNLFRF